MSRKDAFVLAVATLSSVMDLANSRRVSARVVGAAWNDSESLPVPKDDETVGEQAEEYVLWQYSARSKPAWVED